MGGQVAPLPSLSLWEALAKITGATDGVLGVVEWPLQSWEEHTGQDGPKARPLRPVTLLLRVDSAHRQKPTLSKAERDALSPSPYRPCLTCHSRAWDHTARGDVLTAAKLPDIPRSQTSPGLVGGRVRHSCSVLDCPFPLPPIP